MGYELAKLMLRDGHTLGLAARRTEPLEALRSAYPQQVHISSIDVTSPDAPQRILSLIEEMDGIDLYFHSSGIGKQNWTLDFSIEDATLRTNALSTLFFIISLIVPKVGILRAFPVLLVPKDLVLLLPIVRQKLFRTAISKHWNNKQTYAICRFASLTSVQALCKQPCSTTPSIIL